MRAFRESYCVVIGYALLIFVNSAFALDLPPVPPIPPVQDPPVQLPPVQDPPVPPIPPVQDPPVQLPPVQDPPVPDPPVPDPPVQLPPVQPSDETSGTGSSSHHRDDPQQVSNVEDDTYAGTDKALQIQPSANATDSENLNTWIKFSAVIVDGNKTIAINSTSQIPQVVTTNSSEIGQEVQSVLLDVTFPPLTNGSDIVSALGLPLYTLPDALEEISVIPALVTTINSGSGQFIVAPLGQIIPGQKIIISVADSLIPSFGGLKEISMQPSEDATPAGQPPPDEWITAEINDAIPSSLPMDGLDITPALFINIQYPFEQDGTGYNWGDPKTHARPPTMTLVINKDVVEVKTDKEGCPIVDAYTLSSGTWTNIGLGEISSESISPEKCHVKIQTQHFSKFAFSLRRINSAHDSGPGLFGLGVVVSGTPADYLVQDKIDAVSKPKVQPVEFKAFAEPSEGFAEVSCMKSYSHTLMVGKYTSGDKPFGLVILKMALLDSLGKVIATGKGSITDIEAHQTKEFHAVARHAGDFDSCSINVSSAIAKIRD